MNGDTKPCLADRIASEIMDTIERERRVNKDDLILAVERVMFADKRALEKANPIIVGRADPATQQGGDTSAWTDGSVLRSGTPMKVVWRDDRTAEWIPSPPEPAGTYKWSEPNDPNTYDVKSEGVGRLGDVVGKFNTVTVSDGEMNVLWNQQLAKADGNAAATYPRTEADRVVLDAKTRKLYAARYGMAAKRKKD